MKIIQELLILKLEFQWNKVLAYNELYNNWEFTATAVIILSWNPNTFYVVVLYFSAVIFLSFYDPQNEVKQYVNSSRLHLMTHYWAVWGKIPENVKMYLRLPQTVCVKMLWQIWVFKISFIRVKSSYSTPSIRGWMFHLCC